MKQSIIVFMLFLILVALYRIYTLKQREGFQTTASCPDNVDSNNDLVNLVQRNRYNCLEKLDVSKVQDMKNIFYNANDFNQDINGWVVSGATDMTNMFFGASSFNQPLKNWGENVSGVKSMEGMFAGAKAFNQDISDWKVESVKNMQNMFSGASSFNQPLNNWGKNVSGVKNMYTMFYNATSFNQDISGWEVGRVNTMNRMFSGAEAFNQDISDWDVSGVINFARMFEGSGLENDDTKTNLKKIYCSWKDKVTDGGKSTFDKEMKRCRVGGHNCPTTTVAPITTGSAGVTTVATTVAPCCIDLG